MALPALDFNRNFNNLQPLRESWYSADHWIHWQVRRQPRYMTSHLSAALSHRLSWKNAATLYHPCHLSWFFFCKEKTLEPWHDKTNKMSVHPVKTQISLGIRPVWSESSLCAQWVAKGTRFLHADSEYSDQTGWMPRLICVFAGRTLILLVLSCRGSYFLRFLKNRS